MQAQKEESTKMKSSNNYQKPTAHLFNLLGDNRDFEYAVHWNKEKTNLHAHIIYSERERQKKEYINTGIAAASTAWGMCWGSLPMLASQCVVGCIWRAERKACWERSKS